MTHPKVYPSNQIYFPGFDLYRRVLYCKCSENGEGVCKISLLDPTCAAGFIAQTNMSSGMGLFETQKKFFHQGDPTRITN